MKQTIRITSNYLETTLAARTIIGGREMVLTDDWFMMTADAHATDPVLKNKPLMDQVFTAQRRWFEYSYDTKDPFVPSKPKIDSTSEEHMIYNEAIAAFEINKRKRDATREFWGKHRQIKHLTNLRNGFVPDLPPVATLEVTSQTELNNHLKDMKYVEVFNRVLDFNDQELLDCCLYYKPVLYGKTKGQMRHGLLSLAHIGTDKHFFAGALFQEGVTDDFLNNYDPKNSTIAMKIYVEKAIMMGIIRPSTGGFSLPNGTFIGKDSTEAVVYFNSDQQSYTNIIQPQVNAMSKLPEDDMADLVAEYSPRKILSADKAVVQTAKNAQYVSDLKQVQDEYERLGGRKGMGYNDMKVWIEQKNKENDDLAKKESLPTKALEIEVEPWQTDDLNKLKMIAKGLDISGWQGYTEAGKGKLKDKIKEKLTAQAV